MSNVGAACFYCNVSKGGRLHESTPEQRDRLAHQQAMVWNAISAIDVEVFWKAFVEDEVVDVTDLLMEDYEQDPEWVERDDIEFNLDVESWREEFPLAPDWLVDYAVDQVYERLKKGDPGGKTSPRTFRII